MDTKVKTGPIMRTPRDEMATAIVTQPPDELIKAIRDTLQADPIIDWACNVNRAASLLREIEWEDVMVALGRTPHYEAIAQAFREGYVLDEQIPFPPS